jgi:hypothetical protein
MTSRSFVNDLQDAVRENPVSATLVGVGLLWMFAGGSRISAAAALFPAAAKGLASGAAQGLRHSADAAAAAGAGAQSVGTGLIETVRDTVTQTAAAVGDSASHAYDALTGAASDAAPQIKRAAAARAAAADGFGGALQSNLRETFERQPLLLGAIGIAIGAGMAAATPISEVEKEFAGETAANVTAQVKEFASEQAEKVTETAERTLEAVKQEAAAQGLTASAAKNAAATIGTKVKEVARAVRESDAPGKST